MDDAFAKWLIGIASSLAVAAIGAVIRLALDVRGLRQQIHDMEKAHSNHVLEPVITPQISDMRRRLDRLERLEDEK